MKQSLRNAVDFARFCVNEKLDPLAVAELVYASEMAALAGGKAADTNDPSGKLGRREISTANKVLSIAVSLGLSVCWPGFYPSFKDAKGYAVHLPYVK